MFRRSHAVRALGLSAAALLLLTACWTSPSATSESPTEPSVEASSDPTQAATPPADSGTPPTPACAPGSKDGGTYTCVGVTVTGAAGKEPTVALEEGFPPAQELQVADVFEGAGDPVTASDTLTVQYVGVGQQSGKVFQSSWPDGQPATFVLSQVIPGWQQGLLGMMPGGRRLLVIPGSLAYGPDGRPPVIGKDETLVFVVDLVSASPA